MGGETPSYNQEDVIREYDKATEKAAKKYGHKVENIMQSEFDPRVLEVMDDKHQKIIDKLIWDNKSGEYIRTVSGNDHENGLEDAA